MRRFAMTPVVAVLLFLFLPTPSTAQYITVGAPSGLSIQPCVHDLSDVDEGAQAGWLWNHYGHSSLMDDVLDNTQEVLVTDLDEAFYARIPWLYFNSHGGVVVQTYPPNSVAVRDDHYNDLVPSLYPDWQVEPGTHWEDDAQTIVKFYTINCNEAFARNHYRGWKSGSVKRSVVHFAGCDAWAFRSEIRSPASGDGAAIFLSYNYRVFNNVVQDEGNTLYYRMSGGEGVSMRPLHQAKSGLTILVDPATISPPSVPDVVIAPRVKATSLASGAHFAAPTVVTFDFDAAMNSDLVESYGTEGYVKVDNGSVAWNNPTQLRLQIRGLAKGSGALLLRSYNPADFDFYGLRSDSDIGINGNTDPNEWWSGDDYRISWVSDYADNPWASASGFVVEQHPAGPLAHWVTEWERHSDRYVVEAALNPSGPFDSVSTTPSVGAVQYSVPLPNASGPAFRLTEVDSSGARTVLGYTLLSEPQAPTTNEVDAADAEATQAKLNLLYPPQPANQSESVQTVWTDLIFTPTAYQTQAQNLATSKNSIGIPTQVFVIENIGGETQIKPTIAANYVNGARNILLYGDANIWKDVQGNLREGQASTLDSGYVWPGGTTAQPALNIVSMGACPMVWGWQATSMPFWRKFLSYDWWYIDLDGDGLPDPGMSIGRLPCSTADEATNGTNKQILAHQLSQATSGMNNAFVWSYEFDVYGNSGADVSAHTDRIVAHLPASLVVRRFSDKPTAWWSNTSRDSLFKAWYNIGASIRIIKGTANNKYHDAGGLDQTRFASLEGFISNPNRLGFTFNSACGGADFFSSEMTAYMRPLGERLLENRSDLGDHGRFGPATAIWQTGAAGFDTTWVDWVYNRGAPNLGQASAAAVYTYALMYPQYREMVLSYVYIGDPSVKLPFMHVTSTVGVEDQTVSQSLEFAAPYPNPSAGRNFNFRFSLPRADRINFSIVDVTGRSVATIIDGNVEAGAHSLRWDATDRSGARVPSGMYFAHLRVGSMNKVQKMVVLR